MSADSFTLADGRTVKERLLELADKGNKPFSQQLHPGIDNVLGLRIPHVRALAKEITSGDWEKYLQSPGDFYMEERLLHGIVLGNIKVDSTERYIELVDNFVHKINSWSVCDTFNFYGKKRFVNKNRQFIWDYLAGLTDSDEEYVIRFGVVMLMKYYIDEEHVNRLIDLLESISHKGYYVSMAIAWAMATAYVKYPDIVTQRLTDSRLDPETFNKTISKIIDSYRATSEQKAFVKDLRDKKREVK